MDNTKRLFVSCGTGLEPILREELIELGFSNMEEGFRGLYVPYSSMKDVYKINYQSRIASRVLLPLYEFKIKDPKDLYEGAKEYPWEDLIRLHQKFAIDFSVDHHGFKNELYAAQLLKDALCDRMREKLGSRPDVDVKDPDVQLHLLIRGSKVTISLDTSLVPLHERGYRAEGGEAPLHENLAAALLRIAKYKPEDIVLDPCCGSGTFLIEAALMATNTPPGYLRNKWGFETHPDYKTQDWINFKTELREKIRPFGPGLLIGIDINRARIADARGNVRIGGLSKMIKIDSGDLRSYTPNPKPTMIIANPPYGKRLEDEKSLIPLYRALGDLMKKQAPARGYVLSASLPLTKEIGLKAERRHIISHGGSEARFLEFDIY